MKTKLRTVSKTAWITLMVLLFLYSLFPLHHYFPYYQRSHEWALPYTSLDFFVFLVFFAGVIAAFFLFVSRIPDSFADRIHRAASNVCKIRENIPVVICCLIGFGVINLVSFFILGHIPHVQDSIAQLFQAKIFLTGSLTADLPVHKEFFEYMNVINDGRWYSQYLPGHPLLLMTGLWINAPWIINPVLGALSVFTLYGLVKTCYSNIRTTFLSVLLLILSPFFIFMSASFMNHTPAMFFILLCFFLHAKARNNQSWYLFFLSGCALGFAANIRPLTAVAMGIPVFVDHVISGFTGRDSKKGTALFAAGLAVFLLLLFWYNACTTGSPFLFGYQAKFSALGFLGASQFGPSHTLLGGVVNTNNNLVALNKYLFEWPIPSLVFAVLLFCPGMSRNRWDWFFLLSFLSLVAAYFIYYYQDLCFGPRFYFSAVPVLVILSVRGFLALPSVLNKYAHKRKAAEASLYSLLACCFLYMIFCSLPSLCRKYSDDYWYVGRKFLELIEEKKVSNAIVFMDVSLPRNTSIPNLLPYGEGFLHNSPLLNTDIIYALDLGRKNSDLMSTFPGRKYYVLTYEPVPTRFKKTRPEIREMTKDTIEKVSTGLNLAVSKHYSR